MAKRLKKVIIAIVILIIIAGIGLFLFLFGGSGGSETYDVPENCEVEIVFSEYTAKDDVITFDCNVYLENHSSEDKYYKLSGDFEKEYSVKMIEERSLTAYDKLTDFDTFFVPAQTQGIFEVKFVSKGDGSIKKPDRNSPGIVVEEVSEELVESGEFVKDEVYLGINGNNDVFYNLEEE